MEGYFEETGRAGAGWTGFDYQRMKDLPPLPDEGAHTLDEMWTNITYFLKAVDSRRREGRACGWRSIPTTRRRRSVAGRNRSWPRLTAGRN